MTHVIRWTITLAVAAGIAILTGCAKPPQARMDSQKNAMELAEIADAANYAPVEFEAAREAERTALAEVEAQNQKFALTRSYETAREMLDKASAAAETARAAAVANRELAKTAADQAVEAMNSQLAAAEADLAALAACRKKPKGFTQDLELMRGKVEALTGQLAELQAKVDEESYKAAVEFAESIQPEISAVATDLSSARAKLNC
jgi:hypothetical protein